MGQNNYDSSISEFMSQRRESSECCEFILNYVGQIFSEEFFEDGTLSIEDLFSKLFFINRNKDPLYKTNPMTFFDIIKVQGPRQVCQYQFRKNDIVWICKQCQKDETCVLCNECYQLSSHVGHEVYFYHSQAGGCCDCGDPDAWASTGFCTKHGKIIQDPLENVPGDILETGKALLDGIIANITRFADDNKRAFELHTIDVSTGSLNALYTVYLQHDDYHTDQDIYRILEPIIGAPTDLHMAIYSKEGRFKVLSGRNLAESKDVASKLAARGLQVGVFSQALLDFQTRVQQAIGWLYKIAQASDGICRMVCNSLSVEALVQLMEADGRLTKPLALALHGLYLTLMADQRFKGSVAVAYAKAFTTFSATYANGIGASDTALFGLSVQFLNRATFVAEMVCEYDFLRSLSVALDNMLLKENMPLTHPVLVHRRYNMVLGDMKVVFSTPGTSRRYCTFCLEDWLRILERFQYMHGQTRSLANHVEFESREWMQAFNLSLGLSSVFEYLSEWFESPNSKDNHVVNGCEDITATPITPPKIGQPPIVLCTVHGMVSGILQKLSTWQEWFVEHSDRIHIKLYPRDDGEPNDTKNTLALCQSPPMISFHLLLHRFYSSCLRECCKLAHLTSTLARLQSDLSMDRGQLILLVDFPLLNILLCSAVRAGMWRRNGQCMVDQILNYAEAPFCRMFRDLDILLLQFCVSAYGPNAMVNHILYRYGLHDYVITRGMSQKDRSESFLSILHEEVLVLFILLVTELPLPPSEDRTITLLRREVVHKLVNGPCTYSQLHEVYSIVPDHDKVPTSKLAEVIAAVAEARPGVGLEPSKMHLREECWSEYDPSFPHVTHMAHQHAFEFRPKIKQPEPMVKSPPSAHMLFSTVRPLLLSDRLLLQLIRDIFYSYAALRFPENKSYDIPRTKWALDCSDNLFSRALHLLTLVVHDAVGEDGGGEEKRDVNEILENKEGADVEGKGEANMEVSVGSGSASQHRKDALARFLLEILPSPNPVRDTKAEDDSGVIEEIIPPTLPALIYAMADIYDSCAAVQDTNNKLWLRWIIDRCRLLSPEVHVVVTDRLKQEEEEKRALEMELRRKRAREKAMQALNAVKVSAEAFAAKFNNFADSDESGDEGEGGGGGDRVSGKSAAGIEHEFPMCIVCHDPSAESRIGYIGFSQATRLHHSRKTYQHLAKGSEEELNERNKRCGVDVHIQFCGHALHLDCLDQYFSTVVQRSDQQGNLILDTVRGQFQCPLCKKLSNFISPVYNPSQTIAPWKEENEEGRIADWVTWIDSPSFVNEPSSPPSPHEIPMVLSEPTVETTEVVVPSPVLVAHQDARPRTASGNRGTPRGGYLSSLLQHLAPSSWRSSSSTSSPPTENDSNEIVAGVVEDEAVEMPEVETAVSTIEPTVTVVGRSVVDLEKEFGVAIRFLKALLEPKIQYNPEPSDSEHFHLVVLASSAIAYTVASESADGAPGLHLFSLSDKLDDLKHISDLARAIQYATSFTYLKGRLAGALNNLVRGIQHDPPKQIDVEGVGASSQSPWLTRPLLEAPLFDMVVLGYLTIMAPAIKYQRKSDADTEVDEGEREVRRNTRHFISFMRWMCIAELVQTIVDYRLSKRTDCTDHGGDAHSGCGKPSESDIDSQPMDVVGDHGSLGIRSDPNICHHLVGLVDSYVLKSFRDLKRPLESDTYLDPAPITALWIGFLRNVTQFVLRVYPALLPTVAPGSVYESPSVEGYIELLGLLSSDNLSRSGKSASVTSLSTAWLEKVEGAVYRWIQDSVLFLTKDSVATLTEEGSRVRLQFKESIRRPARLLDLPDSYTILHGNILAVGKYEYPAICLVCGAITDAGGKGECMSHAKRCTGDHGVFFLLQDCLILLCHGPRAAYFPAPYVDEYGEKHRHFRGKPLHLDRNRYEAVRKLWATHSIPREAVQRRSSSNRVIINNHY